jgi:hypothetical protein
MDQKHGVASIWLETYIKFSMSVCIAHGGKTGGREAAPTCCTGRWQL